MDLEKKDGEMEEGEEEEKEVEVIVDLVGDLAKLDQLLPALLGKDF